MDEKFDYNKAIAELEEIDRMIDDPATTIADFDKYVARSVELIKACRAWLREKQEETDKLDANN